jgi:hypothetical protein
MTLRRNHVPTDESIRGLAKSGQCPRAGVLMSGSDCFARAPTARHGAADQSGVGTSCREGNAPLQFAHHQTDGDPRTRPFKSMQSWPAQKCPIQESSPRQRPSARHACRYDAVIDSNLLPRVPAVRGVISGSLLAVRPDRCRGSELIISGQSRHIDQLRVPRARRWCTRRPRGRLSLTQRIRTASGFSPLDQLRPAQYS